MRYIPESWAPEHTAPLPEEDEDDGQVELAIERSADDWGAVDCTGEPFSHTAFVDGARRRDTWVVAEGASGDCRGLMATWAAGAVVCDRTAEILGIEVDRAVFCNATDSEDVTPIPGFTYKALPAPGDSPEELTMASHRAMLDLEVVVAGRLPERDLLVLDGPLRGTFPSDQLIVGYVKTHYRAYGNRLVADTVAELEEGQRTPVLRISRMGRSFYTWYVRLPGSRAHRWADIARCELSGDQPRHDLPEIANQVSRTLLPFASKGHQDPRAPQNLLPIGALERELHHRMGDRGLFLRALSQIAGETP